MAVITIGRGLSYIRNVQITNTQTGQPEDITGWKIYFTMKCSSDTDSTDSKSLIQKLYDDNNFTDASTGQFQLKLDPEDTQIPFGDYIFDFKTIPVDNQQGSTLNQPVKVVGTATNKIK